MSKFETRVPAGFAHCGVTHCARIEEFAALAGHEHIHRGMTSRDLTENVEQLQVRQSLALIRDRAVAALARLAAEHEATVIAGARRVLPLSALQFVRGVAWT